MKKVLFLTIILCFGGLVFKSEATTVGVNMGAKSNSIHSQYPIKTTKEPSMQTGIGLQIGTEAFSTSFLGSIDMIGNIAYDNESPMNQKIIASNLFQRNIHETDLEIRNEIQIAEGSGRDGVENLSTSMQISRVLLPAIEGRVIGGYNYNYLHNSLFLVGLGLSTESILTCKIDIDFWAGKTPTLMGKISKEVGFCRVVVGTMANTTQKQKVWFEIKVFIDDLSQYE